MANEPVTTSHTEAAQARIQEIRAMRQQIPNFVFPAAAGDGRKLSAAASVPSQFVEMTAVAVKNNVALVRGGGSDPSQSRDLLSYADAYEPVAAELDALAQFVRHSVAAARNKVGTDALTTYALAQRLAKSPETADLVPLVREMRRVLGRGRKSKATTPETPEVPGPTPVPATSVAVSRTKT
jgi:hypothetical protein